MGAEITSNTAVEQGVFNEAIWALSNFIEQLQESEVLRVGIIVNESVISPSDATKVLDLPMWYIENCWELYKKQKQNKTTLRNTIAAKGIPKKTNEFKALLSMYASKVYRAATLYNETGRAHLSDIALFTKLPQHKIKTYHERFIANSIRYTSTAMPSIEHIKGIKYFKKYLLQSLHTNALAKRLREKLNYKIREHYSLDGMSLYYTITPIIILRTGTELYVYCRPGYEKELKHWKSVLKQAAKYFFKKSLTKV